MRLKTSPVRGDSADSSTDRHARRLERVARQLRERAGRGPLSFKKRVISHQVPKRRDLSDADDEIDVSDLDEILEIDAEAMTCTAEPGVTFTKLVEATLRYGLVPIVVPELKTITIGGAVSGCSLESMSFKYGGFHDTCLAYEVVTASGDVMRCTPDNEHQLIFQMMHGSFGTLGFVSKLKFRLLPAKPYVRMTYDEYGTLDDYKAAIWRHFVEKDVDFVDGIIHSPNKYVLSLGSFVDEAPYTNRYDWMKVYYLSTAKRKEDYLATPDYFFRYDHGVTNVHPKSAIGRLLFGRFFGSDRLLRLAKKFQRFLPVEKPTVILDVFIPFSKLDAFMSWYRNTIGFFPMWCVPYRRVRDYEWISPDFYAGLKDELFVDLAIYGLKQRGTRNYYKEIEDELVRVNGMKTLISHNYYEEDAFWRIWNKPNYAAVKNLTDPKNIFRDLYAKTCGLDGARLLDRDLDAARP